MPTRKADIEGHLSEFVLALRQLKFPESTIPLDLANFVASAMQSYLDGKAESLDHAFGLIGKKGQQPYGDEHWLEIARNALAKRKQGMAWKAIADSLCTEGVNVNERDMRKAVKEYEASGHRISDELLRRLSGDKSG